jgi:hypothetical protein
MSSDTVYSAFRTWLEANWTATTIRWENETFLLPAPTVYPAAPAAFIAVELSGNFYRQMSLGSGTPSSERWAEAGAILVYSLVQAGASSLAARQNATAIADLARGVTLPGTIRLQGMTIGEGGPGDEDGNWWQIVLRIEFLRG